MAAKRHLNDEVISRILEIIHGWPRDRKFGWEELREAIQFKFHLLDVNHVWTRQQLTKYPSIQGAYRNTKARLRASPPKREEDADISPELRVALDAISKLKAENATLKVQIDRLLERFERWLYNAKARSLDEDILDQPLPEKSPMPRKKKSVALIEDKKRSD